MARKKTFWDGASYLGQKAWGGLVGSVEGIWDFAAGGIADWAGADEWAKKQIKNDWMDYEAADRWYKPTGGMKFAGDVAAGIGNSIPALGVGLATGGAGLLPAFASTFGVSFLSAGGNAVKEAYRDTGKLTGKEWGYGALSGATEGLVEGAGTLFGLGQGAILKQFGKTAAKSAARSSLIGTLISGAAGEAAEEFVSAALDPYFKQKTYNPDAKFNLGEALYSSGVGAMSGLLMAGGGSVARSSTDLLSGSRISGDEKTSSRVINAAKAVRDFEQKNQTGNEVFEEIAKGYDKLEAELKANGGAYTISAKKQLGYLNERLGVGMLQPQFIQAAETILADPSATVESINKFYGNNDLTVEELTKGIEAKIGEKGFSKAVMKAVKSNSKLRELIAIQTLGNIELDSRNYADAIFGDTPISTVATQENINRFVSGKDETTVAAVSSALGVDLRGATASEVAEAIERVRDNGGLEQYREATTAIREAKKVKESTGELPTAIMAQGQGAARYTVGGEEVALIRNGNSFRLYDYSSGNISNSLTAIEAIRAIQKIKNAAENGRATVAEANTRADAENAQRSENSGAEREENANQRSSKTTLEAKNEETQGKNTDTPVERARAEVNRRFCKENVPEYNKLITNTEREAVEMTVRQARLNGMSDADAAILGRIAAKSGMNIYVKPDIPGENAFYDGTNGIYVSANAEKSKLYSGLLGHEMFHKLFASKKGARKLYNMALKNIDEKTKKEVIDRYTKAGEAAKLKRDDNIKISFEEAAAAYSEEIFNDPEVWDYILGEETSLKEDVINFFTGAAKKYSFESKISIEARKWVAKYRKLFNSLSHDNVGASARRNASRLVKTTDDSNEAKTDGNKALTTTNEQKMQDSGKRSALFSFGVTQDDINRYVDNSYNKQNTEDYKPYAVVNKRLLNDVSQEIDITGYVHALRDNDIRHIKNSHGEDTNEKYPVTKNDLAMIPYIVTKYDKVFVKQNSRGESGLVYVKVGENNVIYYVEAVTTQYHNEKLLVNKQLIKAGIDYIPNLVGLEKAITKKESSSQYLADLQKIRKAYVQDVKENYSDTSISQNSEKSNSSDKNSSENLKKDAKSGKRSSLKASEFDSKYLSAVERGDMKTAQRMVDEAAKEAGYTVKGLHATNAEFTVFDINKTSSENFHGKGIYFTNSVRDLENNYENYEGPDPWQKIEGRAYELAYDKYGISYEDTLTSDSEIIDKLNECYDIAIDEFKKSGRRITAYLRFDNPLILEKGIEIPYDYAGYDGIIDKQVYDNIGHSGMDENTIHYVVFNPNNIKSADPVTYDDKGAVIPLSERFNPKNKDIRFSLKASEDGMAAKARAELFNDKVYNKSEAQAAIRSIKGAERLTAKEREALADTLWIGLNEKVAEKSRQKQLADLSDKLYEDMSNMLNSEDATEVIKLKIRIFDAVKGLYKNGGHESKKAKVEAKEANVDNVISMHDEYNKATLALDRTVRSIRDKLRGSAFDNATVYNGEGIKGILSPIAAFEYRRTFSSNEVREKLGNLLAWYNKDNPMLCYETEEAPGVYLESIHNTLESLALSKSDLTVEELKSLDDVLHYFVHIAENYRKVWMDEKWIDADPLAKKYASNITKNNRDVSHVLRAYRNKYIRAAGTPETVMLAADGFTDGFFSELQLQLRTAEVSSDEEIMEISRELDDFVNSNKKYARKLTEKTVELFGAKFSKVELMEYYMALKRKQAHEALAYNGIVIHSEDGGEGRDVTVAGFAQGKKDFEPEKLDKLAAARRAEIEKEFSEKDKRLIEIFEKGYEKTREIKSKADIARLGISNVIEGYYYPIKRAYAKTKTIDIGAEAGFVDRFANASFNKHAKENAKQPLVIGSAYDTFTRHVKGIVYYSKVSPVVDSYNKMWKLNLSANNNTPRSLETISKQSEATWREGKDTIVGNKYFRDEVYNIMNGSYARNALGSETIGGIRGKAAVAALAANIKVMITQISSWFSASSKLSYSSLVKGLAVSARDVDQYCKLAELRNRDKTAIKASGIIDGISGIGEFLTKHISFMDRRVICRLFGACQVEVARNGGPKLGTEENKIAAGKLLENVILETQQNAFVTTKNDMARNGGELVKSIMMFRSDAVQATGKVFSEVGRAFVYKKMLSDKSLSDSERAAIKKLAKKSSINAGKAIFALALSSAWVVGASHVMNLLFNKEKDKDKKPWAVALLDLFGNLLGGLPGIADVYEFFTTGFDIESMEMSVINDMLAAAKAAFDYGSKALSGEVEERDTNALIKRSLFTACQATGVPARNLYNTFYGLTRRFNESAAYRIDDNFKKQNYAADFKEAAEDGKNQLAMDILEMSFEANVGEGVSEKTLDEFVRLATTKYDVTPGEISKSITIDGESYDLTAEERETVQEIYSEVIPELNKLIVSRRYQRLDDKQKQKEIKNLLSRYRKMGYDVIRESYGAEKSSSSKKAWKSLASIKDESKRRASSKSTSATAVRSGYFDFNKDFTKTSGYTAQLSKYFK